MIYTRFGGQVDAVENVDLDTGQCEVLLPGRGWRTVPIGELKADGGLDEIIKGAEVSGDKKTEVTE